MSKLALTIVLICSSLAISACTIGAHHDEVKYDDIQKPKGSYDSVINHWTDHEKNYTAFSSSFQVTASLLSNEVIEHQVYLDAQKLHWTSAEYKEQHQKVLTEAQTTTTCFVSIYTAKDENNNLDKKNTSWNIFLESNDKHILPTSIKRVYESPAVLMVKYPYLNVWSRIYLIKFPISTAMATENAPSLIIAGPAGDAHLHYPKN
jgi:hypothetical protein